MRHSIRSVFQNEVSISYILCHELTITCVRDSFSEQESAPLFILNKRILSYLSNKPNVDHEFGVQLSPTILGESNDH